MKKIIFIIIISFFAYKASSIAQNCNYYVDTTTKNIICGDSVQLPSSFCKTSVINPTNYSLNSVKFINNNIGYAVGNSGKIFKTTNAGNNWTLLTSGTANYLFSVFFTNANTGYAVGCYGTILKTTNDGITWTVLASGTLECLQSVYFTDSLTGYVAGTNGTILKTTNAGSTWTALTSGTTNWFNSVYFTNTNIGYAVGGWDIFKTTNAGNTWTALVSGTTNELFSVYFTDSTTGYVVGRNGTILNTTNAGNTWISSTSGTTQDLTSVYFTDANTGFVVGDIGTVLKTTNAGNHWKGLKSGTINRLISVYFTNSNTGYAVGVYGQIVKITDIDNALFSWQPTLGLDYTNISAPKAKPKITTTYKVTITSNSSTACGIYADSVKVLVTPMNVNAGIDITKICGDSIIFNPTTTYAGIPSNLSWLWSPASGLNSATIKSPKAKPITTTNYIVNLISSDGCTSSKDTIKYTVNPMTVNAGTDKTKTCGDSVTFNPTTTYAGNVSNLTWSWSPTIGLDNSTIKTPKAKPITTTNYAINLISTDGCIATDTIKYTVNPMIVNAGTDKTKICGDSVTFNPTTTYAGNVSNLTWSWSPTIGLDNSTIKTPKAKPITTTNYTLNLTSTDGCIATDTIKYTVNPMTVNAGTDLTKICGDSVTFNPTTTYAGNVSNLSWSWSPANGLNSTNIKTPIAKPFTTSNYFVNLSSTDGCASAIDSIKFTINSMTVNAGTDLTKICGDSVIFSPTTSYAGNVLNLSWTWSPANGLNSSTIKSPVAKPNTTTTYIVNLSSSDGCVSALDTIKFSLIPLNPQEICMVSIRNYKNMVIWDKPIITAIDSFYVWREANITGIYNKIGAVAYSDSSLFIDTTSNPAIQSNKYKLSVKDFCNLESNKSSIAHKTMHLSINQGTGTSWNLIWEDYEGFTVNTYNIFRGTTPNNLTLIGTTSGSSNQYTDFNAPSGNVYYQLQVVSPNACNPSKLYNMSLSNIATNASSDIFKNIYTNTIKVYPNPVSNELIIEMEGNKENLDFEILNSIGKVIYKGILIEKTIVQTSEFALGVYLIKINNGNTYQFKKIVKE